MDVTARTDSRCRQYSKGDICNNDDTLLHNFGWHIWNMSLQAPCAVEAIGVTGEVTAAASAPPSGHSSDYIADEFLF